MSIERQLLYVIILMLFGKLLAGPEQEKGRWIGGLIYISAIMWAALSFLASLGLIPYE